MTSPESIQNRDGYWDSLKFILIFLVVFGHIIEPFTEDSVCLRSIWNMIYSFHMPLFLFISGRFSLIRDKTRYKKSILRLLESYLVFQVIRTGVDYWPGFPLNPAFFVYPKDVLWYLLALALYRLAILIMPSRFKTHPRMLLLGSVFIGLFGGFIPVQYFLSLQRVICFLPFFILGYITSPLPIKDYINRIPFAVASSFIVGSLFFIYLYLHKDVSWVVWGNPYMGTSTRQLLFGLGARVIFYILAVFHSAMIMRLVPANFYFAQWGGQTLFIFLWHPLIWHKVPSLMKWACLTPSPIICFCLTLIIVFGLLMLSNIRIFTYIMNPISTFLNSSKCFDK